MIFMILLWGHCKVHFHNVSFVRVRSDIYNFWNDKSVVKLCFATCVYAYSEGVDQECIL